nr:MAG TPA: hypothetical protein [Bacteriophage sp.]
MARLSKDELIEKVKKYIGDRTDDETIEIIEDISDSVDASAEESEWKQRYEDNDKMWRDKYISRFFEKKEDDRETPSEHEEEEKEYKSFEDLFEEEEN